MEDLEVEEWRGEENGGGHEGKGKGETGVGTEVKGMEGRNEGKGKGETEGSAAGVKSNIIWVLSLTPADD